MKTDQSTKQNTRRALAVLLAVLMWPLNALAQPATQNVEVDPVTCWWRTVVASVRVGEPFTLLLTCSVLETDAARAVIDRSRLGSASVQFPPYEVITGSQSADHVTVGRRFIQYAYTLRLVAEGAFGADVPIPALEIAYRIESRVQEDAAVQGREQSYVLPSLSMRVASLVPVDATHIRESAVPTLTDIAAREFRARVLQIVAFIVFGVAALTLALTLVRWARQKPASMSEADRDLLAPRTVLAGVSGELRALQQETRGGWTPETIARGLTAARIVGSYLAGKAVAQRKLNRPLDGGELVVGGGWLGRRMVAVSGTTTSAGLASATTGASDIAASDMDAVLTRFTLARYGRDTTVDSSALDDALATTTRAAARVASRHTWFALRAAAFQKTAAGWRPQAWAR